MALETLKGVGEIGGFRVAHSTSEKVNRLHRHPIGDHVHVVEVDQYVTVNHKDNAILFEIQDGPIKENGVNGCQVDTLIYAAIKIISELNKKFPCRENSVALTKLDESIMWLEKRKKDREKRGVEGTSKA